MKRKIETYLEFVRKVLKPDPYQTADVAPTYIKFFEDDLYLEQYPLGDDRPPDAPRPDTPPQSPPPTPPDSYNEWWADGFRKHNLTKRVFNAIRQIKTNREKKNDDDESNPIPPALGSNAQTSVAKDPNQNDDEEEVLQIKKLPNRNLLPSFGSNPPASSGFGSAVSSNLPPAPIFGFGSAVSSNLPPPPIPNLGSSAVSSNLLPRLTVAVGPLPGSNVPKGQPVNKPPSQSVEPFLSKDERQLKSVDQEIVRLVETLNKAQEQVATDKKYVLDKKEWELNDYKNKLHIDKTVERIIETQEQIARLSAQIGHQEKIKKNLEIEINKKDAKVVQEKPGDEAEQKRLSAEKTKKEAEEAAKIAKEEQRLAAEKKAAEEKRLSAEKTAKEAQEAAKIAKEEQDRKAAEEKVKKAEEEQRLATEQAAKIAAEQKLLAEEKAAKEAEEAERKAKEEEEKAKKEKEAAKKEKELREKQIPVEKKWRNDALPVIQKKKSYVQDQFVDFINERKDGIDTELLRIRNEAPSYTNYQALRNYLKNEWTEIKNKLYKFANDGILQTSNEILENVAIYNNKIGTIPEDIRQELKIPVVLQLASYGRHHSEKPSIYSNLDNESKKKVEAVFQPIITAFDNMKQHARKGMKEILRNEANIRATQGEEFIPGKKGLLVAEINQLLEEDEETMKRKEKPMPQQADKKQKMERMAESIAQTEKEIEEQPEIEQKLIEKAEKLQEETKTEIRKLNQLDKNPSTSSNTLLSPKKVPLPPISPEKGQMEPEVYEFKPAMEKHNEKIKEEEVKRMNEPMKEEEIIRDETLLNSDEKIDYANWYTQFTIGKVNLLQPLHDYLTNPNIKWTKSWVDMKNRRLENFLKDYEVFKKRNGISEESKLVENAVRKFKLLNNFNPGIVTYYPSWESFVKNGKEDITKAFKDIERAAKVVWLRKHYSKK